jgi:hypothetical protein
MMRNIFRICKAFAGAGGQHLEDVLEIRDVEALVTNCFRIPGGVLW